MNKKKTREQRKEEGEESREKRTLMGRLDRNTVFRELFRCCL